MEKGLVHIYHGNGKGKTTAAVGLCTRAAGSGLQVLFVQFLKDGTSGELRTLRGMHGVRILKGAPVEGFLKDKEHDVRAATGLEHRARFAEARRMVEEGAFDLVVFDEAMATMNLGLLPVETMTDFLDHRPVGLEVVLTGRRPPKAILDRADYISEIRCVRHPYQKGIDARKGIEW